MPEPLPQELRLELKDILSPRIATDNLNALPRAEGARFNVLKVKERPQSEGIAADWACAQGLSRRWGAKAAPRLLMPCLLHSSSTGYWLGSRGRHASVAEHARAQGVEHGAYSWPKDPTAFALLGNSMARCILQRLLHCILCSWGILEGPDPWLRGEAQGRLRAEAAGHTLPVSRGLPPAPGAAAAWGRLQQALSSPTRGRIEGASSLGPGGPPSTLAALCLPKDPMTGRAAADAGALAAGAATGRPEDPPMGSAAAAGAEAMAAAATSPRDHPGLGSMLEGGGTGRPGPTSSSPSHRISPSDDADLDDRQQLRSLESKAQRPTCSSIAAHGAPST